MRTQKENKKERKALKDWKKPELKVLNTNKTLSGALPDEAEVDPTYSAPS